MADPRAHPDSKKGSHQEVVCCNRCPGCAYRLDGLDGVPSAPYAPFTADLSCPECGLFIPTSARCVVGSALEMGVDGRRHLRWIYAAIGALALVGLAVIALIVGRIMYGGSPSDVVPMFMGLVGVGFGLAALVRPVMAMRALDPDAHMGGGDVRLLFEPGVLRVFIGRAGASGHSCAGSDVTNVSASSVWRFFARVGAPPLMVLRVQTPVALGGSAGQFGVTGYFLVPRGVLPTELAQDFAATLRLPAGAGVEVPSPARALTPDAPPRCPHCHTPFKDQPAATGLWREPLEETVVCDSCGLVVPAGAMVLCGWTRSPSETSWRRRVVVWGMVGVVVALGAAAFLLFMSSAGRSWSLVWTLQALAIISAMVLPRFFWKFRNAEDTPRPDGRFQPTDCAWIVEPGRLRIVRRRNVRSMPAARLGRISVVKIDAMGPGFILPESLCIRGTAPELGLQGEATMNFPMHSGVDRDALIEQLNRTLKP
jgi:hypothetical protein